MNQYTQKEAFAALAEFAISNSGSLSYCITTHPQRIKELLWDKMVDCIPQGFVKRVSRNLFVIRLNNGSVVKFITYRNPDLLRGLSIDFVVLDNIKKMEDKVYFEALRPALAQGSKVILVTNKLVNEE